MSDTLNNQELADAISAAHNRAGTSGDTQIAFMRHLEALLAIQRTRASGAPKMAESKPESTVTVTTLADIGTTHQGPRELCRCEHAEHCDGKIFPHSEHTCSHLGWHVPNDECARANCMIKGRNASCSTQAHVCNEDNK